jgi:hypothetical protein
MLLIPSTVRRTLRGGLPQSQSSRRRRNGDHHTRRAATIGATCGLAVGAAAGALPFILRGTLASADDTQDE